MISLYCRFCGRYIENRVKFCPECGNSQDMAVPIREEKPSQPFTDGRPSFMYGNFPQMPPQPAAEKVRLKKTKAFWAGKLMILSALLCFMLPFFRTSVRLVNDHSNSYSGIYIIFDAKDDAESDFMTIKENKVYTVLKDFSYVIGISALLALAALFMPKISWFFSGASAMTLLIFGYCLYRGEDKLNSGPYHMKIDVDIEYGLVAAAVLLALAALILAADEWAQKRKLLLMKQRKPGVTNT